MFYVLSLSYRILIFKLPKCTQTNLLGPNSGPTEETFAKNLKLTTTKSMEHAAAKHIEQTSAKQIKQISRNLFEQLSLKHLNKPLLNF